MDRTAPNQRSSLTTTHPRSPWPTFAVCAIAFYVIMFDLAVVNVAFPDMLAEFEVSRSDGAWIVSLYNILFGSLLVVAGKTADSIGRRRLLRVGFAVFGLGAGLAAFAPSFWLLLAGRAVQGIGAAVLSPAALGLLVAAFPLEQRTQTMALWGAVGALGVSSGPSLGAGIIQLTSWRAAFWVPLVLCAALLMISGRSIAETPKARTKHRPDLVGALVITGSLAALVLGVSRSGVWGWGNPRTATAIGVGLLGVAGFVARQRRHSEPIVDLTLFRSRSFTVASWSGLIFFGGYSAYNLNNVLFLRQAWSYSVIEAGLLAVIGPLTVALLSPLGGLLAKRFGFRLPAIAGSLVVATGATALATTFDERRRPGLFMVFVVIVGIGIALFNGTNAGAAVAELPAERLSIGGAVTNALRQVGAAFGVAVLVVVVATPVTTRELVDAHSRGYLLVAGVMMLAAILSGLQTGRRRGT